MLDVDKQPEWECPVTGVVKENASIECLRPVELGDEQFKREWQIWFTQTEQSTNGEPF